MENNEIPNNLSDEEIIDYFVEGIMEEKGVDAPTDEIRESMKKELKDQLMQQIDRSLVAELPDEKLEELTRTASANGQLDPQVVADAINEAGLDIAEITAGTMQRFREIYLGKTDGEASEPAESAEPAETTESQPSVEQTEA